MLLRIPVFPGVTDILGQQIVISALLLGVRDMVWDSAPEAARIPASRLSLRDGSSSSPGFPCPSDGSGHKKGRPGPKGPGTQVSTAERLEAWAAGPTL